MIQKGDPVWLVKYALSQGVVKHQADSSESNSSFQLINLLGMGGFFKCGVRNPIAKARGLRKVRL